MNKIIFKYLLTGLCLVVLSACGKDDTEKSTITNVPMTIESIDASGIVNEVDEQLLTINFALDDGQIVDTKVQISVDPLRSTATEGEDFILSTDVVELGAYIRSSSFQIQVLNDLIAEGDETVTFIVSGLQEPFGASNTQEYVLTIKDFVDEEALYLTFDWEGLGFYLGTGYSLCENVDMDIYVLDTNGDDQGIYDAATGACPERIIMDATWADGTYVFASNMWENGFAGLGTNTDFPIRIAIDKPGVYNSKFTPEDIWTSEDLDQANDGNTDFKACVTVVKNGDTYTVTQPDGSLIIEGFVAPHGKVATMNGLKGN